jgi:hypothetical protein
LSGYNISDYQKVKKGKSVGGQRHLNTKASITNVTAEVENYLRDNVRILAQAHGVLAQRVHTTLHKDLQLSKKSARWMIKLLDEEMKKEPVKTCKVFIAIQAAISWPSETLLLLMVSWQGVKSELASLTLTQKAS